jgi:hypothetical protein
MAREDLEKVTIRLNRGHAQKLDDFFPSVGYNKVIRTLVANFLKGVEEKAQKNLPKTLTPQEIDVEEIMPNAE